MRRSASGTMHGATAWRCAGALCPSMGNHTRTSCGTKHSATQQQQQQQQQQHQAGLIIIGNPAWPKVKQVKQKLLERTVTKVQCQSLEWSRSPRQTVTKKCSGVGTSALRSSPPSHAMPTLRTSLAVICHPCAHDRRFPRIETTPALWVVTYFPNEENL